jgi:aspartate/tyrosine/aromatic aminotransferase
MSFFERVPLAPPDPIFGLAAAFQADERQEKVNLSVGVYCTEELKTPVMKSVKMSEEFLLREEKSKGYLPISGDHLFIDSIGALLFGKEFWGKEKERIAGFQAIGGTGALKIGGSFLKEELEGTVYISNPTWPNHRGVFESCGLKVEHYPYYNSKKHVADFDQLYSFFEQVRPGSILIVHASCHNPTGSDLTFHQWKEIGELCRKRKLIPFFDCAYQGLGKGLAEDAAAVRHFAEAGIECLVAVSNAKNFSIYGERVGSLFIVSQGGLLAKHITSRVTQVIRTTYSNPPMHGAKVVGHILSTPSLRQQWEEELHAMRHRMNQMRALFCEKLMAKSITVDFSHLKEGVGMFGFCCLEKEQVEQLKKEHGIYMTSDGRANVCGLNHHNIDSVVNAIISVTG